MHINAWSECYHQSQPKRHLRAQIGTIAFRLLQRTLIHDRNRLLASATSEEEKVGISAARASLLKLETLVVEAEKQPVQIDWKYFEEAGYI